MFTYVNFMYLWMSIVWGHSRSRVDQRNSDRKGLYIRIATLPLSLIVGIHSQKIYSTICNVRKNCSCQNPLNGQTRVRILRVRSGPTGFTFTYAVYMYYLLPFTSYIYKYHTLFINSVYFCEGSKLDVEYIYEGSRQDQWYIFEGFRLDLEYLNELISQDHDISSQDHAWYYYIQSKSYIYEASLLYNLEKICIILHMSLNLFIVCRYMYNWCYLYRVTEVISSCIFHI